MTTTLERLCRALAAVAFLLLAAPAVGVAESDPSPDAGVAKARSLFKTGKFDAALAILRPLALRHPKHTNVLFLVGLAAIQSASRPETTEADRDALLEEAIASLRAILVDRPELVRVRLELARAFFLKGEDDLARRHFEQVLAGKLPDAVVANVRQFLARIRARRNWSVYLGMALAPDNNIGASSEEETIYIFGLPFRRNVDELTTSGVGLQVWTGGEYQHPLGERLRLRTGVNLSQQEHAGKNFDQTYLSGHAGPRWLVDGRTEASLLADARRRWVGGRTDHDDVGARFEARRRLGPRAALDGRASWHRRDYERRDYLDGPVTDLSLTGRWVLSPTVRANTVFGYSRQRTKSENWRNRSRRIRFGTSVALPRGFTVGGSAQMRWTGYEGRWFPFTLDGSPREDRTSSLSVSLLHRNFTLFGFSPQVAVTREVRSSNAQLYDFQRTRGELRFVRQF